MLQWGGITSKYRQTDGRVEEGNETKLVSMIDVVFQQQQPSHFPCLLQTLPEKKMILQETPLSERHVLALEKKVVTQKFSELRSELEIRDGEMGVRTLQKMEKVIESF